MFKINKNSIIGSSNLKNVSIGTSTYGISGTTLSSFLYSQNIIDFNALSSNSITFRITNLGIDHTKILIRANTYTACTVGNRSVNLIV